MENVSANCDDVFITEEDLRLILLTKGITGALSLLTVGASLIMVFLFAKFKQEYLKEIALSERLLVYHGFATIFRAVATILQTTAVDYSDEDDVQQGLCGFTGFLDQWSVWVVLLSIQMLVVHILVEMCKKRKEAKKKRRKEKKKKSCCLFHKRLLRYMVEVCYILFPITFPLLFSYAPFIMNDTGYGLAGGWCWIERKPGHCDVGVIWQFTFWFGPLIICQLFDGFVLIFIYPVLVCYMWRKNVFNNEDGRNLLKQHGPLLALISLSIIVNWFSVGNRLYIAFSNQHSLVLWCFHAIMASSWGILAAIVIFFYILSFVVSQQSSANKIKKNPQDKNMHDYVTSSL